MFRNHFAADFLADLRAWFTLRRQTTVLIARWKTTLIAFDCMRGSAAWGSQPGAMRACKDRGLNGSGAARCFPASWY